MLVDVRTAWVIEGLGHGHEDLESPDARSAVLRRDGRTTTANASLRQHQRITPETIDSFHFHGDGASFPVTAVLAVPPDDRAGTLLRGRYLGPEERVQLVRPSEVMAELLETIWTVEAYAVGIAVLVGGATGATACLVFLLSVRLRRREIRTLHKIGASRGRIAGILALEIALVLVAAAGLAAALTGLTAGLGPRIIRALILGS